MRLSIPSPSHLPFGVTRWTDSLDHAEGSRALQKRNFERKALASAAPFLACRELALALHGPGLGPSTLNILPRTRATSTQPRPWRGLLLWMLHLAHSESPLGVVEQKVMRCGVATLDSGGYREIPQGAQPRLSDSGQPGFSLERTSFPN